MLRILVCMEANKIARKETIKQLVTYGENREEVTAWERGVQEETNLYFLPANSFPQHG